MRYPEAVPIPRGGGIETLNRIAFLEFEKPAVDPGEYVLTINQNANVTSQIKQSYSEEYKFKVDAPQFKLEVNDVYNVYPPNNSKGKYLDTLPHIVLNRSTLPWERKYYKVDNGSLTEKDSWKYAWMGLLLFSEDEAPVVMRKKVSETDFGFQAETDDQLNYIEVSAEVLEQIMPSDNDFPYLSHVMANLKAGDDAEKVKIEDKKSVVICNRFPILGKNNIVHLVALEKDFDPNGENESNPERKNQLVSLHSWSFFCEETIRGFEDILRDLSHAPFALTTDDRKTNPYLKNGYVPMGHHLRRGEKVASWYHSPLVPMDSQFRELDYNPTNYADKLLMLDDNSQMLDISYASSWQLGRTLTLREKDAANAIFKFHKKNYRTDSEKQLKKLNLQINESSSNDEVPSAIGKWIRDLYDLKNIPFNYLVPHADMLPLESIRFFRIDLEWLKHLASGAFSIGAETQKAEETNSLSWDKNTRYTGFIMRSKVVTDYPDLLLQGSNENPILEITNPLDIVAQRKIGKDIWLVIFDGGKDEQKQVKTIDIFIAPTGLHFGVSSDDGDNDGKPEFSKVKRIYNTDDISLHGTKEYVIKDDGTKEEDKIDITNYIDNNNRLKVASFATTILDANENSTKFAFQMLEGTPKVRFYAKKTPE